jgi:hypothetical protein
MVRELYRKAPPQYEPQLAEAHTFNEILSIVALASGPRIAETTVYDTATASASIAGSLRIKYTYTPAPEKALSSCSALNETKRHS